MASVGASVFESGICSTNICGSDLHMYEGRTPAEPDFIFGHENMGIVSSRPRATDSATSRTSYNHASGREDLRMKPKGQAKGAR